MGAKSLILLKNAAQEIKASVKILSNGENFFVKTHGLGLGSTLIIKVLNKISKFIVDSSEKLDFKASDDVPFYIAAKDGENVYFGGSETPNDIICCELLAELTKKDESENAYREKSSEKNDADSFVNSAEESAAQIESNTHKTAKEDRENTDETFNDSSAKIEDVSIDDAIKNGNDNAMQTQQSEQANTTSPENIQIFGFAEEFGNNKQNSPQSDIEELMENGETFTLFDELLPAIKWVKIPPENYLIGTEKNANKISRFFFGQKGTKDNYPTELQDAKFFQIDNSYGYWITETLLPT